MWIFHSEGDLSIPVRFSRDLVAALKKAGGVPKYTEYPAGTYFFPEPHWAWVPTYANAALRDWLFGQSK